MRYITISFKQNQSMAFLDSLLSALIKWSVTLFEEKHERQSNQEDRILWLEKQLKSGYGHMETFSRL